MWPWVELANGGSTARPRLSDDIESWPCSSGADQEGTYHMTTLEQLELSPEIVRELRSQYVDSVEDLLTLAAQPNEREALLADMKWGEPRLEVLLTAARRLVAARRSAVSVTQ
jgi:hypothetical protein